VPIASDNHAQDVASDWAKRTVYKGRERDKGRAKCLPETILRLSTTNRPEVGDRGRRAGKRGGRDREVRRPHETSNKSTRERDQLRGAGPEPFDVLCIQNASHFAYESQRTEKGRTHTRWKRKRIRETHRPLRKRRTGRPIFNTRGTRVPAVQGTRARSCHLHLGRNGRGGFKEEGTTNRATQVQGFQIEGRTVGNCYSRIETNSTFKEPSPRSRAGAIHFVHRPSDPAFISVAIEER